jgi:hypothetical protein
MAVETLLHKNINIKDFHPAEERPKNPRGMFEELKNEFYDSESRIWSRYEEDENEYFETYAYDQLLGVLMEGLFDKKEAKKQYEELKKTVYYDDEQEAWMLSTSNDQQWIQNDLYAKNHLLDILIKGMFDKNEASTSYEQLKQTTLYDQDEKIWYQDETDSSLYAEEQLVGVLVEGMFDKEKARKLYDQNKQDFYDDEKELWYSSGYRDIYYNTDQLLGVLTEALFDKDSAKRQYKKIKGLDEDTETELCDELYKIMIEKTLEEPKLIPEKVERVPEVRRF